jgi:lipoprotein NlpD
MRVSVRSGFLVVCIGLLAACASDEPAPVEERSVRSEFAESEAARPPVTHPAPATGTYRVQTGDTLYAIAFNHGLDYRDLAQWNRIPAPYRIYVGQELRLDASPSVANAQPMSGNPVVAPVQDRPVTTIAPLPSSPPPSRPSNPPPPPKSQASSAMFETVPAEQTPPPSPPPVEAAPPQKVVATNPPPPTPPSKPPVAAPVEVPKPAEPPPQLNAGGVSWRWPASGNVVGTFVGGDQTKQGVDIAGNEGDPVFATADGEVVYSGNGLIGYGELIIIKHNSNFLSAYGHNRKRLVREGEKVKAGQKIAEMGATAAARNELHFEIRKNGKPVNPLEYLPVR